METTNVHWCCPTNNLPGFFFFFWTAESRRWRRFPSFKVTAAAKAEPKQQNKPNIRPACIQTTCALTQTLNSKANVTFGETR